MIVHANNDELLLLAKSFYNVSNTLLTIYDINKNSICNIPNKMCDFCSEVRKSPELAKKCFECDASALEMCSKTHSIYAYKCHMGLLEVAAPIIQNNIVIGYMLFGQITDTKDKNVLLKGLHEKSEKYNLDYEILKSGIQKIKYRSPEYISSIIKMLEMCASYILQNSFINIKNDTIAHLINIYIFENLNQKLSVDTICSNFHISRSTLYEISKKFFGYGITDYIALCRINKAKELLSSTEKSISEISNLLGMDNVSYFVRFFKRHVGITPKKYRTNTIK